MTEQNCLQTVGSYIDHTSCMSVALSEVSELQLAEHEVNNMQFNGEIAFLIIAGVK